MTGDDGQVIDDDEVHPPLRVLVPIQRLRNDVEIHCVYKVDGHGHHVGDGQRRQDTVGGGDHVSPRQDDDVDNVGDDTKQTDDGADVAVVFHVVTIKLQEAGHFGRRYRGGNPCCHKVCSIHHVMYHSLVSTHHIGLQFTKDQSKKEFFYSTMYTNIVKYVRIPPCSSDDGVIC